jgi:hypothetical protein
MGLTGGSIAIGSIARRWFVSGAITIDVASKRFTRWVYPVYLTHHQEQWELFAQF